MAALEEPPHRGQAVQIYSRSSGGWISSTVEAVDGEEATVLYNVDGREMRKVVDWDDPEQLIAAGPGQAVGPSVGASSPAPQSTTWAASAGAVFDPDEEDYGQATGVGAGEEVVNPLGYDSDGSPMAGAANGMANGMANGVANGVAHGVAHGNGATVGRSKKGAAGISSLAPAGAPAPSPESLLRQKPADSADSSELLMWMKDMIENQHKDIAELRETVKASVEAGGGSALSLIAGGGLARAEGAKVDDVSQTREALIEFIHKNPIFAGAGGINPEQKENFIELIAGRLERRFYYKDSMIIRKGADATEMFFIYKGVAEVFLDHPDTAEDSQIPPVAKLMKGTFFGEAALLAEEREQRNAWIRAQCDMECYVLTAEDLKIALKEHPAMAMLFNAEKHRRAQERDEHLERFATGGGNFRRGFKVRLRTLGTKEKLAAQVAEELMEAFETVPEVFPRSAVEALLLDKMEKLEDIRDQLAAKGIHEEEHGHGGITKPPTAREKKKIQMQMGMLAVLFMMMCFVPYVSEQHHSGKMHATLLAICTHCVVARALSGQGKADPRS
jgi:CRP-like cAMP-binding protein